MTLCGGVRDITVDVERAVPANCITVSLPVHLPSIKRLSPHLAALVVMQFGIDTRASDGVEISHRLPGSAKNHTLHIAYRH